MIADATMTLGSRQAITCNNAAAAQKRITRTSLYKLREGLAIGPFIVLRRLNTTIITVLLPAGLVSGRYVFLAELGIDDADE